jgi:hypothetical protein
MTTSKLNRVKFIRLISLSGLFFFSYSFGQSDLKESWSNAFKKVEIVSSFDGKIQQAYFYATHSKTPKPLIISLHTWGGNYKQTDILGKAAVEKDWNYIHPDFRGANNNSEACGSYQVISDIDDAISYALKNANTDSLNVNVIGASGGGYATLLAYMRSTKNIRSFSAWVPISNLEDWYYESLERDISYAKDLSLVTTGNTVNFNPAEARSRSPFFMTTPVKMRINSNLNIFCGINDGYSGSVPISQSINFYNKVVGDFDTMAIDSKVGEQVEDLLIKRQYLCKSKSNKKIGDRKIIFQINYKDKVSLTIFEGGHEILESAAFDHIH